MVAEFAFGPIVMFVELVAWVERIEQNLLGPRVKVDIIATCAVIRGLGQGALLSNERSVVEVLDIFVLFRQSHIRCLFVIESYSGNAVRVLSMRGRIESGRTIVLDQNLLDTIHLE